jgi:NAD(P)-dependent dehydrogenase (short-subunit alcohol dehydrogenase family)
VVLAARRAAILDEVAGECIKLGGRALAVPTGVVFQDQVDKLARQAMEAPWRIDVWLNSADEVPMAATGSSFEPICLAICTEHAPLSAAFGSRVWRVDRLKTEYKF